MIVSRMPAADEKRESLLLVRFRGQECPRHTILPRNLSGDYLLNFLFQFVVGERTGVVHRYFAGAIEQH